MKKTDIFEEYEIQRFITAAEIGGIRKDATYNVEDILESANDSEEILEKYDSMSETSRREFRQLVRESIKLGCDDFDDDEDSVKQYDLRYFTKFIAE